MVNGSHCLICIISTREIDVLSIILIVDGAVHLPYIILKLYCASSKKSKDIGENV